MLSQGDAAAETLLESAKLAQESERLNHDVPDFIDKVRAA